MKDLFITTSITHLEHLISYDRLNYFKSIL